MSDDEYESGFGCDGEPFESIPMWEDVWDVDEEGRQVWTPYIVTSSMAADARGPERYAEWPGVFKDGKQIGPMPGIGWIPGQTKSNDPVTRCAGSLQFALRELSGSGPLDF